MARIISVSISEEFYNLMTENNISPTEAFRTGLAVIFCDLNIFPYKNQKNENRSQKVREFMENLTRAEKERILDDFSSRLNEIEEIIKKIKGGEEKNV